MKVKDALELLSQMPPDADLRYLWDGEARSVVCHVWKARNGDVILADQDEPVYAVDERPADAPSEEDSLWRTPWLGDESKDKQ